MLGVVVPFAVARLGAARLAMLVILPLALSMPRAAQSESELDYGFEARKLKGFHIEGNEALSDNELKEVLLFKERAWYRLTNERYTPDQLQLGIDAIRNYYRRQGFHEVEVTLAELVRDDSSGDDITIRVVEGPQTTIGTVVFAGNSPFTDEQLGSVLSHPAGGPAPYFEGQYGRDVYSLRIAHVSRGYLSARVALDVRGGAQTVDLIFTVMSGPEFTVDEVRIEGNEKVKEKYIKREMKIAAGDVFSMDNIVQTEADLLETGWFRDVNVTPTDLDTLAATTALRLSVIERPSAFYELGVGVEAPNRGRASLGWGDNNLFGTGKGLVARGKVLAFQDDIVGQENRSLVWDYDFTLSYAHPHLFGTRYRLGLSLFHIRESRGSSGVAILRTGLLASTALWEGRNASLGLELLFQDVRKRVLKQVSSDDIESDTRQTNWLTLPFRRDTRDSPFMPRSGSVQTLVGWTAGGPVLNGDNHFLKSLAAWVKIWPVAGRSSFAVRAQVGAAAPWWESRGENALGVPLENRFFAGGITPQGTVRGYRNNSLGPRLTAEDEELVIDDQFLLDRPAAGGNAQLLLNAEYRFPLPLVDRWGFGGLVFADGGNVWEDWTRVSIGDFRPTSEPGDPSTDPDATRVTDFRTSVGFGVFYRTPIGPVILHYGRPLKRAEFANEDGETQTDPTFQLRFSLGYVF